MGFKAFIAAVLALAASSASAYTQNIGNWIFTWPSSGGTANYVMTTSGSGGVGTWAQVALGSAVTGTLPIANGGTNGTSAVTAFDNLSPMTAAGDLIYGGASGTRTRLAPGTSAQVLHSGTTPSWGAVSLTGEVSGVLPLANGGTNKNLTPAAGGAVYTDADSVEVTAAGTSGQVLTSNGASAPTWQTPSVTSPGGTDGAVQYNDGGAFGGQAANFYWDDVNFRLGIGTNAPAVRLDVQDSSAVESRLTSTSGATAFFKTISTGGATSFLASDSVSGGLGTIGSYPLIVSAGAAERMRVNPTGVVISAGNYRMGLRVDHGDTIGAGIALKTTDTGGHEWDIFSSGTAGFGAGNLAFYDFTAGANRMVIDTAGRIGIGDDTPDGRLDIAGSANEVQLRVTGNGTQTANLLQIESSAPTDLFVVQGDGAVVISETGGNGGNVLHTPTRRTNTVTSSDTCAVDCSAGEFIMGGGCSNTLTLAVFNSYPVDNDTWECLYDNALSGDCTAYAICAQL